MFNPITMSWDLIMRLCWVAGRTVVGLWLVIRRFLGPVVEPVGRPLQRWDDRRSARHLRESATVVETLFPGHAAEMRVRAAELEGRCA